MSPDRKVRDLSGRVIYIRPESPNFTPFPHILEIERLAGIHRTTLRYKEV
jgi:hypothetical protein